MVSYHGLLFLDRPSPEAKGLISTLTASDSDDAGPGHPRLVLLSARLGTLGCAAMMTADLLELCLQLMMGWARCGCGWGCPWPWVRANSTCSKAHHPSCVSGAECRQTHAGTSKVFRVRGGSLEEGHSEARA